MIDKIKKRISLVLTILFTFSIFSYGISSGKIKATDNSLSDDYAPTKVTLLSSFDSTGSNMKAHKIGFMPANNMTGVKSYIIFYSKLELNQVKSYLENLNTGDIDNLDSESNNRLKLIKDLSYADGGPNSYYTDQKDLVYNLSYNKGIYHFYAATVGDNGVLGVAEADKTEGDSKLDVSNNIEDIYSAQNLKLAVIGDAINECKVAFNKASNEDNINGYYLIYSKLNKGAMAAYFKHLDGNAFEAYDTEDINRAKKLPLDYADGDINNPIKFYSGQLDAVYNSTFGAGVYHIYVASVDKNHGICGLAEADKTIDRQMTLSIAFESINKADSIDKVLSTLELLCPKGWKELLLDSSQKNDIAKIVYNNGNDYGDENALQNAITLAISKYVSVNELKAVNSCTSNVTLRTLIDLINPPLWNGTREDLSEDGKALDAAPAFLSLIPEEGFKSIDELNQSLNLAISLGVTNDKIDRKNDFGKFDAAFSLLNPLGYNTLSQPQRVSLFTVVKNGNKGQMYSKFKNYNDVLKSAAYSVKTAKLVDVKVNSNTLYMDKAGESLLGVPSIKDGETVSYVSLDSSVLSVDAKGFITPVAHGSTSVFYTIYNLNNQVTSYGKVDINVIDNVPPVGSIYKTEEGKTNNFYVLFNEKMNFNPEKTDLNTEKKVSLNTLIKSIIITNGNKKNEVAPSGTATFLTTRALKIVLNATVDLKVNDIVSIEYTDAVKDDAGNHAVITNTKPTERDLEAPIGKIVSPNAGDKKLVIKFSEEMSEDVYKRTKANDILNSITVLNSKGKDTISKEYKITSGAANWDIDNNSVTVDVPCTFNDGDYIKPNYNNQLKDRFLNSINETPASLIIGGSLSDKNKEIYDEIRKNAGGRNPKIAVVGSSKANLNEALYVYYKDDSQGQAYINLLVGYGFAPDFVPIAVDYRKNGDKVTYNDTTKDMFEEASHNFKESDGIDALNSSQGVYLLGGSQENHARNFFTDEETDTSMMSALRQVYYEGGIIAGSSAGDHIQSSLMFAEGDPYTYLKVNKLLKYSIKNGDYLADTVNNGNGGIGKGFGFIPDSIISESHIDEYGRFSRVFVAARDAGVRYGCALETDTGMLFKDKVGTVLGNQAALIVDELGADINKAGNSYFDAKGVNISYLTTGDQFDFNTGKAIVKKNIISNSLGKPYNSNNVFGAAKGNSEFDKIMASLSYKNVNYSYGDTSEGNESKGEPNFRFVFYKNSNTSAYTGINGKNTLVNVKTDVYTRNSNNNLEAKYGKSYTENITVPLGKLPKTGSPFDTYILVNLGLLLLTAGAAFIYINKE